MGERFRRDAALWRNPDNLVKNSPLHAIIFFDFQKGDFDNILVDAMAFAFMLLQFGGKFCNWVGGKYFHSDFKTTYSEPSAARCRAAAPLGVGDAVRPSYDDFWILTGPAHTSGGPCPAHRPQIIKSQRQVPNENIDDDLNALRSPALKPSADQGHWAGGSKIRPSRARAGGG